jgi:hypothetical protein
MTFADVISLDDVGRIDLVSSVGIDLAILDAAASLFC